MVYQEFPKSSPLISSDGNASDTPYTAQLLGSDSTNDGTIKTGIMRFFRNNTPKDHSPIHVQFPNLTDRKKAPNYISTTKFTPLNFIPLNLFEQFGRVYNIYFLAGALSILSGYSALSPATQVFPLIIILIISIGKEAIEDYGRARADRKANNALYTTIVNGKEDIVLSKAINNGDIVKLKRGEKCPADLIILYSTSDDDSAFVETSELDGESNLKRRSALPELASLSPEEICALSGESVAEYPNGKLNSFRGKISTNINGKMKTFPVTANNITLKGTELRNTDFIYGMAVYTGQNTKIIKNLKKPKIKRSTITKKLNVLVSIVFIYNLILLLSSVAIEYSLWKKTLEIEQNIRATENSYDYAVYWYLGPVEDISASSHILYTFLTFFGLLTYTIPSSLFVTLEIVRLLQSVYMRWDRKMIGYSVEGEKVIFRPNRSSLNEDLGVIEHLFSDKTGTLTMNDMRLSKWFVNGHIFDVMNYPGCLKREYARSFSQQDKITMDLFSSCILTCHDIIPSKSSDGSYVYEGQSPDEIALIEGLVTESYVLIGKNKPTISALIDGRLTQYEYLGTIEFNSDRKRMSVVVRLPNRKIYVFTKGADNVMLNLFDEDQEKKFIEDQLYEFSVDGLRTLVFAYREISDEEYSQFAHALHLADISLDNREYLLDEAAHIVEKDLIFLGASAIEDRLQNEVPETIEYIRNMGIKIWLLTGDKMETAITIGQSSRLLSKDMDLIKINSSTLTECKDDLYEAQRIVQSNKIEYEKKYALIISGEALAFIFDRKNNMKQEMEKIFLDVGCHCESIICCRATPMQKASVVSLAQKNLKVNTMAVGDGSNDVSMIQTANVGIGIAGREGAQAARASDFAIGEFRLLRRLLSVHGRFNYLRLSKLILFSFYKNAMMITVQWWFGYWNLFSGQLVYEEMFLTLYNVLFTSFPPICIGLFDRDVREYLIARYPQLYKPIKNGLYWSYYSIAGMFASIIWHSAAIFFSVWFIHGVGVLDQEGKSTDFYSQMYLFGTPTLIVALMKVSLMMSSYNWISIFTLVLSLLLSIGIEVLMELVRWVLAGTTRIVHVLTGYWVCIVLIPVVTVGVDFFFNYVMSQYKPKDTQILMENSKLRSRREYVRQKLLKMPKMVELLRMGGNK